MKKNFMASIVTVIVTMAKCYAQDVQDPGSSGYFELGWSADGKYFAYAGFFLKHYRDNVPTDYDYSDLNITIIDLVSDQRLWESSQQWKEDNPVYPTSIYAALENMSEDVFSSLKNHGIKSVSPVPLRQFPIENGDILSIETREKELQSYTSSYEFFAVSGNLGEKKIFSFEGQSQKLADISILGYSMNPVKSRMAVFIYVFEGGYDGQAFTTTYVTGCHFTSGFTKNVK